MPQIEILLPVHNEGESIEGTIREIYEEISKKLDVGFIICEDGSRDNTKEVLRNLAKELPLRLNLFDGRKGYSRAVRDGMNMLEAEYLLCLDSDGQCDPKDFWKLWEERDKYDIVMGWRVDRADTLMRKTFSGFFKMFYTAIFRAPVHDPSCPYVLARKDVIQWIANKMGAMQQGYWWEFVARAHTGGCTIQELPVHHRLRTAGVTQVYKFKKLPGIFARHFLALFQIRKESQAARFERVRGV